MFRLLAAALTIAVLGACQHTPKPTEPREPASVGEEDRVFDGTVVVPLENLDFQNPSIWPDNVRRTSKWADWTGSGMRTRCTVAAAVPKRTVARMTAGERYVIAWSRAQGGEMMLLFKEADIKNRGKDQSVQPKAYAFCEAETAPRSETGMILPMSATSAQSFQYGTSMKIVERSAVPPMQLLPIKYSPGDEKILKEIQL